MGRFKYFILLSIISIQGCVGIFWSFPSEKMVNNPSLGIATYNDGKIQRTFSGDIPEGENATSKDEVYGSFGPPDQVIKYGKGERWFYYLSPDSFERNSWRWVGVVPIIILVPIPVLVPIGRESIEFTIENEKVISVALVGTDDGGFACGPLVIREGHGVGMAPGCFVPK